MNEQFANLNAWTATDNSPWLDTILMAENMTLREGGGMRLVGTGETVEVGGRTRYPGAMVRTTAFYQYGYFEFYSKFPLGLTKPCVFLYDSQRDGAHQSWPKNEIDACEYGGNLIFLSGTYANDDDSELEYIIQFNTTKAIMQDVYHKWGIYWDTDAVRIYMDDHLVHEITDPIEIPVVPMNIHIQFAFGEWASLPTDVSWPVYFDVDWVKVWKKDNTYR